MTLIFRLAQLTQLAAGDPVSLRLVSDDGNALTFTLAETPELKALKIGDEIKVALDLP